MDINVYIKLIVHTTECSCYRRFIMETNSDNVKPKSRPRILSFLFVLTILVVVVLCGIFVFRNSSVSIQPDLSIPGQYAGECKTVMINGVKFSFRWCPADSFLAGSPESEEGRDKYEVQHTVTFTKGFWILETEVTQGQWKAVMSSNPSFFKGDNLPVEQVSWNDCQEFCKKCTELGLPIQLPTEAQWEYACRAGSSGAISGILDDMAWYWDNSGGTTHQIKTKKPNAWGLYDMHGNVGEWCKDWYGAYSAENVTDPIGPLNGSYRIIRGGSWNRNDLHCRSARRRLDNQKNCYYDLGFRVVKEQ